MVRAFVRAFVRVSPSAPVLSALSDSLLGPHSSTHSFTSSPSFLLTVPQAFIASSPIRFGLHGFVTVSFSLLLVFGGLPLVTFALAPQPPLLPILFLVFRFRLSALEASAKAQQEIQVSSKNKVMGVGRGRSRYFFDQLL